MTNFWLSEKSKASRKKILIRNKEYEAVQKQHLRSETKIHLSESVEMKRATETI